MKEKTPLLSVLFDGEAVGPGRIPVSHLLAFLSDFKKVLQRTGRVLRGEASSLRPGQAPREVREEVELVLVSLTQGSPAVVLGFERSSEREDSFSETDSGLEVLEKTLEGLEAVQSKDIGDVLPHGYDRGVLMAWRGVGTLLNRGISKIEFSMSRGRKPARTTFTRSGLKRIQKQIRQPQTKVLNIEGRLLMADFKEHGTRCRIHPPVGAPVLCLFDEERKDEILENILQYVRVTGEAQEDPVSKNVTSIKIHDIERLHDRLDETADLLPRGAPVAWDFWESRTLEELAKLQNVGPIKDIRDLFGTWPGEVDDGFEEAIERLRHPKAE